MTSTRTRRPIAVLLVICVITTGAATQVSKRQEKPTERLVRQFEKLIGAGDLLTPSGWIRTSRLFEKSTTYPATGVIHLVSTGGSVGEDWIRGDRAQVETKWNDDFGTIDSALIYKPPDPSGSIGIIQMFSLVWDEPQPTGVAETGQSISGQWKFEGALQVRTATIPAAIRYVEQMRKRSPNSRIRSNAEKTVAALKRLMTNRSPACAC